MNNDWQLFHAFMKYVRWGIAEPVRCPNDNYAMYLRMGTNDEPGLMCPLCNTLFMPGLNTVNDIKAAVEESERLVGRPTTH